MPHAVGCVVPLVGIQHTVWLARGHFLCFSLGLVNVVIRVFKRNGGHLNQLGTAKPEHIFFLLALCFGNNDNGAVSACIPDQRQANAGISGRAFHDNAAGLEVAALFGV